MRDSRIHWIRGFENVFVDSKLDSWIRNWIRGFLSWILGLEVGFVDCQFIQRMQKGFLDSKISSRIPSRVIEFEVETHTAYMNSKENRDSSNAIGTREYMPINQITIYIGSIVIRQVQDPKSPIAVFLSPTVHSGRIQ